MMRQFTSCILWLFLVLLLIPEQISAQSPYRYRYSTEVTIPTVSIGLLFTSFILDKKEEKKTEEYIMCLRMEDINGLDRNVVYNWNPKIAVTSDVLMYTSMATPLLFLSAENSRNDFDKVAVISMETFALTAGLTYLTKTLVDRNRPYMYNPHVSMNEKLRSDASHSFFSGHTSTTAAMSYSFAFMYNQYRQDSNLKPLVWTLAAGLPALNGYFRVKAGKHFWTDVVVGYLVGAFSGWLVPYLHQL